MGNPIDITKLFQRVKSRGLFQTIRRLQYMPYQMNTALEVVEAIGKERTPRFVIDNENRFAYENFIRWIHGDPDMMCLDPNTGKAISGRLTAGIYIAGNTGTGKSWALEIMAAYCLIDNVQVIIGEDSRCLYWENIRTDAICDEYTGKGTFAAYKNKAIVGLQDFGAEPVESLYMGNRVNVVRQLLEYRGDRTDQITLITSNLPINHKMLSTRYDDRVASRLAEMCNYFEIKGKDRRK